MPGAINRRLFLKTSVAGLALSQSVNPSFAGDTKISKNTYTYKKVDGLEIQADVYRADDDKTRPVAIWIHGGALIMGNRGGVSGKVKQFCADAGYALVSIDYRLAPGSKISEIISDVQDAYSWVHKQGPELFNVDTEKIAVLGGSAGGYLTLMTGFCVKPRPTVLIPFWGYGDLVGDWYSKPSEHYRKQPLVKPEEFAELLKSEPTPNGNLLRDQRRAYYLYCRQQGEWPQRISGFDPISESEKYDPYSPVRNVTSKYPPTLMVHGTIDTDVPYEQSVMMEQQFKKHDVEHEFVTVPHAGHGLSGGDRKLIDRAYERAMAFMHAEMQK